MHQTSETEQPLTKEQFLHLWYEHQLAYINRRGRALRDYQEGLKALIEGYREETERIDRDEQNDVEKLLTRKPAEVTNGELFPNQLPAPVTDLALAKH